MGKKIIVFSDGTGQDGFAEGEHPSNVCRLYRLVKAAKNQNQKAFYDPGVGTRRGAYKFGNWVGKQCGLIFGTGISKNIQQCYEFICKEYRAGDEIFLFGFSRGAATVRSLSGLMDIFGVLNVKKANSKDVKKAIKAAYRIYKSRGDGGKVEKFFNKFNKKDIWQEEKEIKIKFLGVWDTVAMLSPVKKLNPFKKIWNFSWRRDDTHYHEFHNLTLSPLVENACHALSIDEIRNLFDPVLWDSWNSQTQNVHQVWFSGVHSDIGGGYQDAALSDITLDWMVKMIALLTGGGLAHAPHGITQIRPLGFMHQEKTPRPHHKKKTGRYDFLRKRKALKGFRYDIYESVFDRRDFSGNHYDPWIFSLTNKKIVYANKAINITPF